MSKRYEVKFYVGTGYDKSGSRITNAAQRVPQAHERLILAFGGFTEYDHIGYWENVKESGLTFVVAYDAILDLDEVVRTVAADLRDIFDQGCVLVTRAEVEAEFI